MPIPKASDFWITDCDQKICGKIKKKKKKKIDPSDERLLVVKELFQKNHDDIVEINRQIKEVKEKEELKEKQKLEQYNPENIFNKKNDTSKTKQEENMDISVVQNKQNIFARFIEIIKSFFKK